jgi:hypothetical protein
MSTTLNKNPSWEIDKDLIAGSESFDDDLGSAYDRVAYDVPNKGNAAGIKLPKRASEMTIGELEDFYGTANNPTEARIKSQAYGAKRFGSGSPQAKYGSSGTGKYQFEVTTLSQTAKDLYGDNYRNVVYSPDEQEKLAKHLYGKKAAEGPQALGNTWVALKNRPQTTLASTSVSKPTAGPSADSYDSPSSSDPSSPVINTWNKTNSAISGEIQKALKVVGPALSATSGLVVPASVSNADTYDSPSSALNKTGTSSGVSSAIAPLAAVGTAAGINRLFSRNDNRQKAELQSDEPVGSYGIVGRMMDPVNKYRKLQPYLTKQVMLKRKTQRTNVPVMRKVNKPNSPIRFKSFRQAIQEQIIKDNSEDSENL